MIVVTHHRLPTHTDTLATLDLAIDKSFQTIRSDAGSGQITVPLDVMARTIHDGVTTNTDETFTSTTAAFTERDEGLPIAGLGIPPGTTIESVTSATEVEMSAAATAPGGGLDVTIGYDLQIGDILRYTIDAAVVAASIIEQFDDHTLDEQGAAAQTVKAQGLDVNGLLAWGTIHPSGGVGRLPVEADRLLSWQVIEYVEGAEWDPATEVGAASFGPRVSRDGAGDVPPQGGYPAGGPPSAAGAFWIWDDSGTTTDAPGGTVRARKEFTPPATGLYEVLAAADNLARVWLDGQILFDLDMTGAGGRNYLRAAQATVEMDDTPHMLAVEATNLEAAGVNPGGIYVVVAQSAGGELGTVIEQTDDSWSVLPYDADPPGMTPGQAVGIVLLEAQDRGALTWMGKTFDDDEDSNGDPWPVVADISTKTGTDLLTFLGELFGSGLVDWRVNPTTLELDLFNFGEMGTTTTVEIVPAPVDDPTTGSMVELDRVRT